MRKEMRKNRPQSVNIWIFICVFANMTINNKNSDIERADLLELAKRYNIKGANSIIDKAITIVRNYEHYAQQAGVSPHWIQKITEEIGYRIEKVKRKF